ncbi:MAG: hypothetical protein AB1609_19775, partial [Bacillota bacterium]
CDHAWYEGYQHDCAEAPGIEWRPTTNPCHATACERCSRRHAAYELERWAPAFWQAYPAGQPLTVLVLITPNWGPRETRRAITRFLKRRPVQRALGPVVGYLHPASDGVRVHLLVRQTVLQHLRVLLKAWQAIVPGGWISTRRPAPDDAFEAAVHLRHEAEQALFLLVAEGALDPNQARRWLEEELGDDGKPRTHRMVFSAGFRSLAGPPAPADDTGAQSGGAETSAMSAQDQDVAENSAAPASAEAPCPGPDAAPAPSRPDCHQDAPAGSPQPPSPSAPVQSPASQHPPHDAGEPCRLGHANCRVRRLERPALRPWWEVEEMVETGKAHRVQTADGAQVVYEPTGG